MLKPFKKFKLILINENNLNATEFSFKKIFLFSLFLFVLFGGLLTTSFISSDLNDLFSLKAVKYHKKNNEKLQTVIQNQQLEIKELKNQIKSIGERDENLRRLVKLPSIDSDTRKLGVGGTSDNEKLNDINYLLPIDTDLKEIHKDINYIKRSINLEKMSYAEIEKAVNEDLDKILHKPAIYPVMMEKCRFSSGFGYRKDPFSKKRKLHEGHDFSGKIGSEVLCTANGTVRSSKWNGSFGNYIEIDHGNGYVTVFGHLSKRLVKKGDKVERGEIIGKLGNTGRSTAPHLHYEIKYNKKRIDPSDFYYDISYSK